MFVQNRDAPRLRGAPLATAQRAFLERDELVIAHRGPVPKTAMHPFRHEGKTLFAASGTNTWLLCGLAATECAVPAGNTFAFAATFSVGTTCSSCSDSALMTPSTGPPGWLRAAR